MGGWVSRNPIVVRILKSVGKNGRSLRPCKINDLFQVLVCVFFLPKSDEKHGKKLFNFLSQIALFFHACTLKLMTLKVCNFYYFCNFYSLCIQSFWTWNRTFILRHLRPCSVDFMDGGATDVPILGPQQTWSGFSPTTVPDNNRQSGFSPTTVPKLSKGALLFDNKVFKFQVDKSSRITLQNLIFLWMGLPKWK